MSNAPEWCEYFGDTEDAQVKLTDTRARAAKPKQTDYRIADGSGLCLLITARGTKLWQYRYRFDGKGKLMALGVYPTVSLSDARERHADAPRCFLAVLSSRITLCFDTVLRVALPLFWRCSQQQASPLSGHVKLPSRARTRLGTAETLL